MADLKMKPLPRTLLGALAVLLGLAAIGVVFWTMRAEEFWEDWVAEDRTVAGASASLLNSNWQDDRNDIQPDLASDGNGNWVAVWQSDKPGETTGWGADSDILYATSTDNAATWSAPKALNSNAETDTGGDFTPSVAYDAGKGNFAAVWIAAKPGQVGDMLFDVSVAACAFASGATEPCNWQSTIISPTGMTITGQARPVIASDGNGNWVVLWEAGDELGGTIAATNSVHGRRSSDLQAWTPVVSAGGLSGIVNHTGCKDCALGNANAPSIAYGNGQWIAVWQTTRGHPVTAYPHPDPTPWGPDSDIVFATSTDGAGWTKVAPLDTAYAETDHKGASSAFDETPVVATNGAGKWVVAWRSNNPGFVDHAGKTIQVGGDFDMVYAFSTDNGGNWQGPYPMPGADKDNASPSNEDVHPDIAVLGAGNWGVVWQSIHDATGSIGNDSDILFTLLTVNEDRADLAGITPYGGVKAMSPTAETDVSSDADQTPAIAADGKARFAAAWASLADLPGQATNSWNILTSTLDLPAPK